MKLVFLQSAAKDIAWFRHYYRSVFPEGAENARASLKALQTLVQANPFVGHPSEGHPGVREFPVKRTPFIMIYRVTDTQIEILRLWDNRQGSDF
jgi:plasmid stabilization system protein ParE